MIVSQRGWSDRVHRPCLSMGKCGGWVRKQHSALTSYVLTMTMLTTDESEEIS